MEDPYSVQVVIVGGEDPSMRVVSWNIRRAASTGPKHHAWTYLTALEPDLLLLQEVGAIPESFRNQYSVLDQPAIGRTGRPQRFGSALLAATGRSPKWFFAMKRGAKCC